MTTGSEVKSLYERLREHYTASGMYRMPQRREVFQLLELRLTPEEAELALLIPIFGQGRVSLTQLAEKARRSEDELRGMLETMIRKGLVFPHKGREDGDVYCLWDFFYSLYTPLYGDGHDDDTKRQITELRERLWQAGLHYLQLSSHYPMNRVMPYEATIDPAEKVEPWERASYYVEQASSICVVACGCRASTNRCTRPLWSCIHFDRETEYWVNYRGGHYLSKDECLQLLADSVKTGV
jgi:hypothetical protein